MGPSLRTGTCDQGYDRGSAMAGHSRFPWTDTIEYSMDLERSQIEVFVFLMTFQATIIDF
jgi:hypothetical protein